MKTNNLLYGAAYYAEYMPYDRIETDFTLMEEAGMNVIRIAESTWSTWEPSEGNFDFSILHRMLDCAKKHNLSVIVGTPTYAIPSWLAKKSDDILAVTHDGPQIYGHRQNMDITNPIYLKHAKIIIEKLMEEVKDEPHVIGFQLDNETKHYDTCGENAQKMFVDYLKKQFPDIEDFNHEFGLDYWSNRISSWDDFPDVRGTINQSIAAEYSKFQRKLVTDFLAWQSDIVSKYKRDDQFITQNFDFEWHDFSFGLQPDVNQYEAARCMTVAGCDIYHPSQDLLTGKEITACGNIARGIKDENYLVLETQSQGNPQWLPYPKQLRLQAYSHISNGSNSVMYWNWHSIHNAIESYWKGVLSHDLAPNRIYRECSVIGNEFKKFGAKLKNLKKENKIAIIANNDSLTGLIQFPTETNKDYSYNTIFRWICDTLVEMNIEYDVIPLDESRFNKYECIIVPALYSASEDSLRALDRYTANGGNLIVTFKSGYSDEHLKIYSDIKPHILHDTLGVYYDEFTYPCDVTIDYNNIKSDAKEWMELIQCDTANPLVKYNHKVWGEYSAVTVNEYKKGRSMYLGTMFGENTLSEIFNDFFQMCGIDTETNRYFDAKYPVSIKKGINDDGETIVYLLNYSDQNQDIKFNGTSAVELISDSIISSGMELRIEPWDALIFEITDNN